MGYDAPTALLNTPPGLNVNHPEQTEHDLRLALLTTASMIGLLRNQLDQVTMALPPQKDDKFHAIFTSKLANVSADLLEFQSLLPVAEQMLCCTPLETVHAPQVMTTNGDFSPMAHTVDFNTDAERMNLFLGSKETDSASNHDTPPPSVAWAEEWAPQGDKREREDHPDLPINARQEYAVSRARSKESVEQEQSKKEGANGKKKALIKFIYTLMQQRGLTDPNGHLLMDVYVEIWNEVVGEKGCGGRAGFHRFAEMLRGAPEYFEVFHVGIAVDESGGSFSGKQRAKMVRLVQQVDSADEGLTPRYRA